MSENNQEILYNLKFLYKKTMNATKPPMIYEKIEKSNCKKRPELITERKIFLLLKCPMKSQKYLLTGIISHLLYKLIFLFLFLKKLGLLSSPSVY